MVYPSMYKCLVFNQKPQSRTEFLNSIFRTSCLEWRKYVPQTTVIIPMCSQYAQCLARISLKMLLKQFYVVSMRVFGQKSLLQHVCFLGFIISYANPYKKNRRHKQTTILQLHTQDVNQFLTSCVTFPFHIFERNVS